MKFMPFIFANLFRKKMRTVLQEGAVVENNSSEMFGWNIGARIPSRGAFIPGIWEFNIRAIYHGTRPADDTTQFWFHWRYFDERKPFGKGAVGWYTIRIDNPDRAVEIIKTIDQEFANSPWETKTDTEKALDRKSTRLNSSHRCI